LKFFGRSVDEVTVMISRARSSRVRSWLGTWLGWAVVCVTFAGSAQGGAWNDAPGRGELIMTTSLFRAWDEYGADGKRAPFGYGGRFQQIQFGNYLEIGLPKRLTLVLNLPISNLQYSDEFHKQQSGGLGDLEIGLRRRLNGIGSPLAVSGQFTVTAPACGPNEDPAPGNHQEDLEGRLLIGRGSAWGERHWFWDGEAAYRYRTGAPADQLRGDFTAGADVAKRFMVMGQFFSIKGLRNGEPLAAITNPNAQSDFDLYKAQGSLVVRVMHKTRVQMGWGHTLAGRNTGRGGTYVLGLWQSF
jgi:protein XagA